MKNLKVPQQIIDSLDIVALKKWCRILDVWHIKNKSCIQHFVVGEGFDGKIYQDENLFFVLQSENRIRKIKFKNINRIFEFTDPNQ